jgi:ABC-type glycerol-3-phosphate transport system permease component
MEKEIRLSDYIKLAFMLIIALIMIFPLIWAFSASFQSISDIFKVPFNWIPEKVVWSNYTYAFTGSHRIIDLKTAYISSIIVSSGYIVMHLLFCTVSGFVFAKYSFRLKNLLLTLVVATMMIPQELTYIPVYGIMRKLHFIDTYQGAILPLMISGFGVFFMRQFATYIPTEMLEAARIDGAGNIRTFFAIVLPLLKPAVSALTILAFSFIWDEFAWSTLVLSSNEHLTIPIALVSLSKSSNMDIKPGELLATSMMAMIPVIVIYLLFQKQFITSVTSSGIKG